MPLKSWKRADMLYVWQYRIYHARPIRHAPPALQLHARSLQRNGLAHRWQVGRYGYYFERRKDDDHG